MNKPTHSSHLERWLGSDVLEQISGYMRNWYGPPIALAGVPGRVYATGDGGFCGPVRGGRAAGVVDHLWDYYKRLRRGFRRVCSGNTLHAGFASLSDLIAEMTANGKGQQLLFSKAPTTGTNVGNAVIARNIGSLPAARGTGGTSGTGVKCTSATTGALKFVNPTAGDTTHITNITVQATSISSLLLFDCLWDMTYNHASSTSTAVDSANRPDRYQTAGLAPGNFLSSEITTGLNGAAHNITPTYVDQDGNTAEAAPAYAAAASAVVLRTNTPASTWFATLNSPDTGLRYVTNIAQSTITSVTGISTFFIGHPLALVPIPIANVPFIFDGINSAFSLERIYDDACLSFMTPAVAAAATITYSGVVRICAG